MRDAPEKKKKFKLGRHKKITEKIINWYQKYKANPSAVIINKVISKTPGGSHYWVESSVGIIRKPAGSIPVNVLNGFLRLS